MTRIYFKNKNDCLKFFLTVKHFTSNNKWNDLKEILNVSRSTLENYRNANYCLPEEKFRLLLNFVPNEQKEQFLTLIEKRDSNWGVKLGGMNNYKLHKENFDKARKIANKKRLDSVKYNFDINLPLSEDLCLFIGAIIGDGFTNKYNSKTYHTQISGDKNLDSDYYHNILKPICEDLFNLKVYINIRNNCNGINFNIYSKRVFELLTKRFNFPYGVKCYTIKIPEEIFNSNKKFLNSTLRGMFDTDGGIGIDKRTIYKKPYVRINYTSASKELIKQLTLILSNYNIPHSIHKKGNAEMIQINGEKNVKKYLLEIGFSNKRHLDKLKDIFRKQ